jgi:hypothetical protein
MVFTECDLRIRKSLEGFVQEMERVLRTHDDEKTGWEEMPPDKVLGKIAEEYREVEWAFVHYVNKPESISDETRRENLMYECVDLANACMMMWDNLERERRDLEAAEKLKGDGDHEFAEVPSDDGLDEECLYCRVRIKSSYGIAGDRRRAGLCFEKQG